MALAACGRADAPRPPRPPRPVQEFLVRETTLAGGIGLRLEIPLVPGRRPVVIGRLAPAGALRAAGFVTASFTVPPRPKRDEPPAESRAGQLVLASPSAAVLGRGYLRTITTTATAIVPRVVDQLEHEPEVDPARIAIVGSSTDGFVALAALAAEPRLAAAVVAFACGDYATFLRFSSMGMQGEPLTLEPDYAAWVHAAAPVNHPGRLPPRPLLLVAGTSDPLIPLACARTTADAVAAAYAEAGVPDRFRFLEVPRGHGVGPGEQQEAAAWLVRWLSG
jgi:predicted esterase